MLMPSDTNFSFVFPLYIYIIYLKQSHSLFGRVNLYPNEYTLSIAKKILVFDFFVLSKGSYRSLNPYYAFFSSLPDYK